MNIVDRRLNPGGKSLSNRQLFLRRAKALVQRAVRDGSSERSIRDLDRGGEVTIPVDGIHEPRFRHTATGGVRDHVLPGNKRFVEGDTIDREQGGSGGSSSARGNGGDDDQFRFVLSREEFLELFLEDLELPDLAKRRLSHVETQGFRRAGYATTGSPVNLDLRRTMRHALARRIALRRPTSRDVADLDKEVRHLEQQDAADARLASLRVKLARLQQRRQRIAYVDPVDLRYRRLEPVSRAVTQAVMFCLMDVSGSMTAHMKDLAKRFYMLLHLFLMRRYLHVEIVFIRHTDEAKEVDEHTFFHGLETGGTIVSSALHEMQRIVAERYPPQDWNIYAAQASDGDNAPADNSACACLMEETILPLCQYFAYLEVGAEGGRPIGFLGHKSPLWQTYEPLQDQGALAMRRVTHRREIYPVFRELFRPGGIEGQRKISF